ncbi:MAG: glycoside hydrolase family 15 protein [Pseudomonadota bacterium]
MNGLDLGIIGNCSIGALVDSRARLVWCCFPRFDGDPVFNALLRSPKDDPADGAFAITLEALEKSEQFYEPNSALLRTRLHGPSGSVEITDCVPRFIWRGRMFRPQSIVRRVRPLSGRPRIRIQLRPSFKYGAQQPAITSGSNHIRYAGPDQTIRLTTDAPLDYVLAETPFNLNEPINLLIGPDETLSDGLENTARQFEEQTLDYWQNWSRRLALPLDWQEAVIRAAITLKLCTYEPTGAIVAALTTSVPEAANSGRTWDYRYCWLRDAFFVVRALNSLGAVHTMENYFGWLLNVVARAENNHLQPVYGIGLEAALTERIEDNLGGYRGMGPVRVGNQAHEHFQHDVYGNLILGSVQTFFDHRLTKRAGLEDFRHLEVVGDQAFRLHDQPDAGMWELRSRAHVHTSSSLMCWAACDRLAKIAGHLGELARAEFWSERAKTVKAVILEKAWSDKRQAFADTFGGTNLDAGVLLMAEVGLIEPTDPRFVSTVERLEENLARGPHMMRYESADDFGLPETAFNICSFWRLDALHRIGRREEAVEIFQSILDTRNHLGLLSEDTDFDTKEMWGNFPQTYSMVGIINGAMRLSRPWETYV